MRTYTNNAHIQHLDHHLLNKLHVCNPATIGGREGATRGREGGREGEVGTWTQGVTHKQRQTQTHSRTGQSGRGAVAWRRVSRVSAPSQCRHVASVCVCVVMNSTPLDLHTLRTHARLLAHLHPRSPAHM